MRIPLQRVNHGHCPWRFMHAERLTAPQAPHSHPWPLNNPCHLTQTGHTYTPRLAHWCLFSIPLCCAFCYQPMLTSQPISDSSKLQWWQSRPMTPISDLRRQGGAAAAAMGSNSTQHQGGAAAVLGSDQRGAAWTEAGGKKQKAAAGGSGRRSSGGSDRGSSRGRCVLDVRLPSSDSSHITCCAPPACTLQLSRPAVT